MRGKFYIDRELLTDGLWTSEKFTRGQAFVDLLGLANHSPNVIIKRGIQVKLDRGDVGWSMVQLADRWGWSRDKVKRFFNQLESQQEIRQQKIPVFTKITLLNYNEMQTLNKTANRQQTSSKRAANESLRTNDNKSKNEKEGREEIAFSEDFIESLRKKYPGVDVKEIKKDYILWAKSSKKAKDIIDHDANLEKWILREYRKTASAVSESIGSNGIKKTVKKCKSCDEWITEIPVDKNDCPNCGLELTVGP